jgi:hypothetical protein
VLVPDPAPKPALERPATTSSTESEDTAIDYQPAAPVTEAPPSRTTPAAKEEKPDPVSAEPSATTAGAIEYEAPAPAAELASGGEVAPTPSSSGSAAGEFGP